LEGKLKDQFQALFRLLREANVEVDLLRTMERQLIAGALQETSGNQSRAARLLGINRNTLRNKMINYGLTGSRDEPGQGPA
jgi:DNA-binding protein Fis